MYISQQTRAYLSNILKTTVYLITDEDSEKPDILIFFKTTSLPGESLIS